MSEEQQGIHVFWPDVAQPAYEGPCPNCGTAGPKPHLLDVAWVAPKLPEGDRKPIFACPACDARFYPPLSVPNYHDPEVMDWGWHQFHIQQGAGLVPITETIGRIDRPAGTSLLEVGCGYGFGLDFAAHARGWQVIGIDPSPMARVGAADLGITIRDGYFPQADPQHALWDVIAATEVIEHVEHPAELLAALRARLAPDGILLLTTPDGAAIDRATPQAALVQVLAPGIHMVFQTEASLRRLLDQAGFPGAAIGRDGLTLVAYAGAIDQALVDDPQALRTAFRAYLESRAAAVPTTTDLGLGFAGRAMFEAAIDGDWPACRRARAQLWTAIRQHFGLDLDAMTALPADYATMTLAALKDAMPLNLGMILYAEASRLRAEPALRPQAAAMFTRASEAASALHGALARLTLNDGLAEELVWRGAAEAAIEQARVAAPDTIVRFDALAATGMPDAERCAITWRGAIELTNQGAIGAARALIACHGLAGRVEQLSGVLLRDAQITLGHLALAEGGDPADAVLVAKALGYREPVAATLLIGGFVRLVNAARYDEAAALAADVAPFCAREDAAGADLRTTLAILVAVRNQPSLARVAAIPAVIGEAIILDAFCRQVATGRLDDAIALADRENIVSRAVARDDEAGHAARFALAMIDLATGEPTEVPARLATLDLDPAERRRVLLGAFSRLVNAARYTEAAQFAAAHAIEALASAPDDQAGCHGAIGLAIVDLVIGDPAAAPARVARAGIDPERQRQISLGAFVTLVNRARYDEAASLDRAVPIAALAALADDADGTDAAIGLIALTLVTGDPATLPSLFARLPHISQRLRVDATAQAALRLAHLGRQREARAMIEPIDFAQLDRDSRIELTAALAVFELDDGQPETFIAMIEALEADGAAPSRIVSLAVRGFTHYVNAHEYAAAARLRSRIEPEFRNFGAATTAEAQSAGFALGLLDLRDAAQLDHAEAAVGRDAAQLHHAEAAVRRDASQLHHAEAAFGAVRRGIAAELADGAIAPVLFWESLRGEMIALHRTERAAEADALAQAMQARYRGSPENLTVRPDDGAA